MSDKHTPLPWDCDEIDTPFYNDAEGNSRGGDGTGFYEVFGHGPFCEEECEVEGDTIVVVERTSKEDAKLIVRAVNNHDALVAACEAGLEWMEDYTPASVKAMIEAALVKAKEGLAVPAPQAPTIFDRLKAAKTMPELDALRMDVVKAIQKDGTEDGLDKLQRTFVKAKSRLERVPLRDRTW